MALKHDIHDAIEASKVRGKVGRSMVFSVCDGHIVMPGGEFEDFSDTLLGKWSAKRATALLRKLHGDDTITIAHTTIYKQYVQMDLLDYWLEAEATSEPVQVSETFLK